ncbi:MAG: FHA domain-containing protein [Anaerolineae bacterium]|jgi:pSer/pThr/pTyr-binding forkhead associated (FHA) protein|nr:FHA domain-containing protein [Anaerolineae bacterium]
MNESQSVAGALPPPARLEFRIGERRLLVTVHLDMVIGRRVASDEVLAIDLSRYGAEQLGVSRRHAEIHVQHGDLYIRDLASTNGTRLNGVGLRPDSAVRLRDGDELELGQLRAVVRFLP